MGSVFSLPVVKNVTITSSNDSVNDTSPAAIIAGFSSGTIIGVRLNARNAAAHRPVYRWMPTAPVMPSVSVTTTVAKATIRLFPIASCIARLSRSRAYQSSVKPARGKRLIVELLNENNETHQDQRQRRAKRILIGHAELLRDDTSDHDAARAAEKFGRTSATVTAKSEYRSHLTGSPVRPVASRN